jgi:HEAT repeat protein
MAMKTFRATAVATVLFSVAMLSPAQVGDKKEPEVKKSSAMVGGKTLLDWMNDLKAKDPSIRLRAIAALKVYGPAAREATPDLIRALNDKDISLKVNAAISLGFIGFDQKDLSNGVNALIGLLREPHSQAIVKFQAAKALAALGSDGHAAIPALLNTLVDKSSFEIRMAAAQALGRVGWTTEGGADRRAITALNEALFDSCMEVRLEALYALIQLGKPHPAEFRKEEQNLQQLISPRQPKKVVIWARVALMRIDKVDEKNLAAIAAFLRSPDMETRVHAARALATVGSEAKSTIPKLIDALDDKEPEVVVWCCAALGRMEDSLAAIKTALEKLANHPEEVVRRAAAEAMERLANVKAKEIDKVPEKRKK